MAATHALALQRNSKARIEWLNRGFPISWLVGSYAEPGGSWLRHCTPYTSNSQPLVNFRLILPTQFSGAMSAPSIQHHVPQADGHDNLQSIENGNKYFEKPEPHSGPSFFSRAYLLGPVKRDHGDLALLACCLVTGMVDAASFSNWSVFCGMQTGKSSNAYDHYLDTLKIPPRQFVS